MPKVNLWAFSTECRLVCYVLFANLKGSLNLTFISKYTVIKGGSQLLVDLAKKVHLTTEVVVFLPLNLLLLLLWCYHFTPLEKITRWVDSSEVNWLRLFSWWQLYCHSATHSWMLMNLLNRDVFLYLQEKRNVLKNAILLYVSYQTSTQELTHLPQKRISLRS